MNEASTTIDQILSSIQNFILEKYVVTVHLGEWRSPVVIGPFEKNEGFYS